MTAKLLKQSYALVLQRSRYYNYLSILDSNIRRRCRCINFNEKTHKQTSLSGKMASAPLCYTELRCNWQKRESVNIVAKQTVQNIYVAMRFWVDDC